GRGRAASLARGLVLAATMMVVVGGIARWAAGQRSAGSPAATAAPAAVTVPSGSVAIAAPSVAAAAPIVEMLPPPAPEPRPSPSEETSPVLPSPPPVAVARAPERDGRTENHHHSSHHHARRVEVSGGAAAEWSDGDPGPRARRVRLRPIDVVDPFAP
ncbi:MAG TPA: hypothetical protein VGL59_15545, partial [Polyangia bacterium]